MARFDGFVLFAEMRTGSNFLEESLNLLDGVTCHGEAFNPTFVGQHNWPDLFGIDRTARDADPLELMRRIFERTDGLGGFRFFHDHAPAVLEAILPNPRIAKIQLTRNPLDAYVSRRIAATTGQWRLTEHRHRKSARIRFDSEEFEAELSVLQAHRDRIRRALQTTGQCAFTIDYEQTGDVDILNGLARFLGLPERLEAPSTRLKRQNPAPLSEKVENFEEMQAALAGMDLEGLTRTGETEPQHGAAVPTFVAARTLPLLYLPIKGGPSDAVIDWLGQMGDGEPLSGFNRKTLRQWKNRNKDARSFVVVSHPVERAHAVFDRYILGTGPGSFTAIRSRLREDFGLPIPEDLTDDRFKPEERHTAFLGYLHFVKRNLSGQTAMRSDPGFSTQTSLLKSLSTVIVPDLVIRADQLSMGLRQLGEQIGENTLPPAPSVESDGRMALAGIYDDAIETAVRAIYNKDFTSFGFRRWTP